MALHETKDEIVKPTNHNKFQKILQNLLEQRAEGSFCEIKLCIQGSVVWGHACVLAPYSSYFRSNTDHWCSYRPIQIDLDQLITEEQDKCVLCLSKLVDFMYSQDLDISQAHLQHFAKLIYNLQIVQFFPLFQEYFLSGSTLPGTYLKENIEQIVLNLNNVEEDFTKKVESGTQKSQPTSVVKDKPIAVLKQNTEKTIDSNLHKKFISNGEVENTEKSQSYEQASPFDFIAREHSYGTTIVKTFKTKCEFVCCNVESQHSTFTKSHKKLFCCEICSITAISVKKFLKHILSSKHFGTVCPICCQTSQSIDNKLQHLKDHDNLKPYFCQFCNKRYRFREYYKQHLKTHCRNKTFCCELCQKTFHKKENLTFHLKSHIERYVCKSCNYLTVDAETFKSHILLHSETDQNSCDKVALNDHKTTKQFLCQLCTQGFTLKCNLKRHIQLTHSSVPNFKCTKCSYLTKRTDLLKSHLRKHHNSYPEGGKCRVHEKRSKRKNVKALEKSGIVGVMIPVHLVSTNGSNKLEAFAVKTCSSAELQSLEDSDSSYVESKNKSDDFCTLNEPSQSKVVLNDFNLSKKDAEINNESSLVCISDCIVNENGSDLFTSDSEVSLRDKVNENIHGDDSGIFTKLQLKFDLSNIPFQNNKSEVSQSGFKKINSSQDFESLEMNSPDELNEKSIHDDSHHLLTRSGEIWLNEATGEFLNKKSFVNLQLTEGSYLSTAENESGDALQAFIFSDAAATSVRDEIDEVDDPDNLFPWSCLDSSFYSTWVLNEATGELNMASFNVQPMKHSDKSKLDDITDEDETALFLNEGTGDLSVIYFNTNKEDCGKTVSFYNEQQSEDVPDNISEHSNNEDNFLNEEFFKATATFMAHKENETFLNELTGEFYTSIADYNNYHHDLMDDQISTCESYLNEETGEISWNVLANNINSDFFTNSDTFTYDPDESLKCDDFEPFPDGMDDLSSQLCLNTTSDWHSVDETCDTLLNECTGEFTKKS